MVSAKSFWQNDFSDRVTLTIPFKRK